MTWADGSQAESFHPCVESKPQKLTGGGREASEEATATPEGDKTVTWAKVAAAEVGGGRVLGMFFRWDP